MKKAATLALITMLCGISAHAGATYPAVSDKAWYDFILGDGDQTEPAPAAEEPQYNSGQAKLVPISGHFDVTSESVMALKLVSGSGDELASSLTDMGFAVSTHEDFHGGYFLMVNIGATDPVEAALTFLGYRELSEVWVKRSLYEEVEKVR